GGKQQTAGDALTGSGNSGAGSTSTTKDAQPAGERATSSRDHSAQQTMSSSSKEHQHKKGGSQEQQEQVKGGSSSAASSAKEHHSGKDNHKHHDNNYTTSKASGKGGKQAATTDLALGALIKDAQEAGKKQLTLGNAPAYNYRSQQHQNSYSNKYGGKDHGTSKDHAHSKDGADHHGAATSGGGAHHHHSTSSTSAGGVSSAKQTGVSKQTSSTSADAAVEVDSK
ncbi:unnamed protein product, partial [Amoebophrya sp. A25]